jgi:hypothetical protein
MDEFAPTQDDVVTALGWVLDYATDQMPHLESSVASHAAYVGRRLDQAWRRLEYVAMGWLEERYQDYGRCGVDIETARAHATSVLDVSHLPPDPLAHATHHLRSCGDTLAELRRCLRPRTRVERRVRSTAVLMHVARRSFSGYRLAKYQWLDAALGDPDDGEIYPHLFLEA